MKFGKRLKKQVEESLPEWRDKFLSYKDLKKLVRLVSATAAHGGAEAAFVRLLNDEVDKFNAFFLEQEEEFIIRQRELQQMVKKVAAEVGPEGRHPSEAKYASEMGRIRKAIVDFHGEMVLLVNYSTINYTGLAKILKKYDKRTGRLLRLPFIEKVLRQPFFTTELISGLVRECESMMEAVFPSTLMPKAQAAATSEKSGEIETEAIAVAEQSIFRNTVAALLTMQELRRGSSTYGQFSLPPMVLSLPESDLLQSIQIASPKDIYGVYTSV